LPVDVDIEGDPGNPDTYIANYWQGGLGLPDRDYYLGDDERFAKARAAYVAYLGKLFKLSGDADADTHANDVMALETALAKAQWNRVEARDPKKTYNPTAPAQLAALAPGAEWPTFAAAAALPAGSTVVVRQPTYVAAVADLLKTQKLATWKLYLKARRIDAAAQVLPAGFRDASFEFHGKAIEGLQQERPRWQLAVAALDTALGEAGGELYVEKYFPPASKARAQALVANLMKAYAASIDSLAWMSPETKKAAHEKLSKYTVKIGYPDKWRDYSKLEIRAGDAFGNRERAVMFEQARRVVRVGQKVDRGEWSMTPQTVNAYYNQNRNEIVFPAAILQPPFFNVQADDAVNYGAIGAVIGHEISHGFDNRGSQYDGDGRLRNWWTEADRKAFDALTDKLAAQFDAYEPIPGKHVNGKLTLGENIADLSGLQIAFKAYKLSLGGHPSKTIDGLTGEQRFFDGFGQIWRVKTRDERALQLLVTDPHSPGRFRANGAAINSDGFHDAFGTKPGDGMWKAPEDRIRLW
jgi:putative endopeptidase